MVSVPAYRHYYYYKPQLWLVASVCSYGDLQGAGNRDYCAVAAQGVCKRNPSWPGWRPAGGRRQCVYACHMALESSMAHTVGTDRRFRLLVYDAGSPYSGRMRPIVTDRLSWSVGLSVCLCVTVVSWSHAKTDESIEMPFGLSTTVGPRKNILGGVHTGAIWRILLNRPCWRRCGLITLPLSLVIAVARDRVNREDCYVLVMLFIFSVHRFFDVPGPIFAKLSHTTRYVLK